MQKTLSERYIDALAELPQFQAHQPLTAGIPYVIHVLTGARVSALPSPMQQGHGLIQVKFPGAEPMEVVAGLYLSLQLSEAAAHYLHAPGRGSGKVAEEANRLFEHLQGKHDLV